ncbi:MAG: DUF2892 domain-containing protein [Tenericutes bacterium HGW-Tenericutes-2]|jgi:hypothetical protein|nr:MAG: DUF2892 domain-containing protein [Tenericutes bacterium HGW-Tenericutes-2]
MKVKKNVGKVDQLIRYVLALIFLVLTFTVSYFFFIGAVVMMFTAYFSFCGLYKLFGINTCKIDYSEFSDEDEE